MKNVTTSSLLFVLLVTLALMPGCKKSYTDPGGSGDPNVVANTTIRDVKARYTTGAPVAITDELIIEGVVACDDKSGNYYQQIAIQDATGGVLLRLAGSNLFNQYPVGRKLFVKLKGLFLGQYNGTLQFGGGVDSAYITQGGVTLLAPNLFDQHIIKGALNQPLTPKLVSISQLTTSLQDPNISTLIQLSEMEVAAADTARNYADASQSGNRILQGCSAPSTNRITLRTSNFANFATLKMPAGNGSITGIYSYFGSTRQLTIRDTSDVRLSGARCGTGPATLMATAELRALFTGTTTTVPSGRKITGVVISDRSTNNLNNQNIYLQQGNGLAGICVRFTAAHTFNLGDSIDINVSGQELSEFNGLLQLNNVPLNFAQLVSTGKTISPRVATLAAIGTNFRNWESTLVRVATVTFSGGTGGRWGGSVTMTDASGTLPVFTSTGASFATATYPTSATSLTGYLTPFNATKQISFRNLTDVEGGSAPPPPPSGGLLLTTSPYTQNFDALANGLPQGVYVKIGASATSLGTGDMPIFPTAGFATPTAWNQTSAGAKNFASATGLTSSSDAAAQSASTNRALGIRQTSATGYDPGASFLFELSNTSGKNNFQMSFLFQSLDATPGGRTATWRVEYAVGDNPSSFTTATTTPATLTTNVGTFASTPVTVNFGTALNNLSQKVWIRIVTLTATTGSNNRPSTAIDDLQLTWN